MTADLPAATPAAPSRPPSAWDTFLFEPESPSPISLVRAAWGALAALWALTLLPDIDPFLTDGALRYAANRGDGSWNPLDHLGSGAPLVFCIVLFVAGVATCVGFKSRLSCVIAALAMLSLQRANTTVFNSGDLVLRQIGIIVALAPSGLLFSVDSWLARRKRAGAETDPPPPRRAPWALRLLQINLAAGYALTAWAKLRGSTWHDGTALVRALRIEDLQRFRVPEVILEQDVLLNLATWGTLLFEGAFAILVWKRRWRPYVLWAGVAFHIAIDYCFDVGFFSWAMIVGYLAFVPPETCDRWIEKLQSWRPRRRTPSPARR